jgi:hypothetical protein
VPFVGPTIVTVVGVHMVVTPPEETLVVLPMLRVGLTVGSIVVGRLLLVFIDPLPADAACPIRAPEAMRG